MNLAQLLRRAAQVHAQRPALLRGGQILFTYGEFGARAARLAGHWRHGLGLQPGDRVALYMANSTAYLECLYAAWWAGLAVVPVNAKLHPRELAHILDDSDALLLVLHEQPDGPFQSLLDARPALRHLLVTGDGDDLDALAAEPIDVVPRAGDDLAWLFYTSGTTGQPKGVMISHRNLAAMTACYFIDVDDVAAADAIVYAAPMSHGAGLYNLPFVARASRHVLPPSGGFDAAELVELSQSVGRLCLFAAPTMVKRLVDHVRAQSAPVNGFKTIVYGGGPMYVQDIREALAVMGPRFVQIYGQGESPMTITALSREQIADHEHPRWLQRLASVGTAQALVDVQVVGDDGHPLPPGQTGEVVVRGDSVMPGYWRNPQASAQALRDGWLWTGDLGALDGDGLLTLVDRSKDLIISGGSNIYPREVEEVLLRHPGVDEVSVVGQPDPEWGELVVAFIVRSPAGEAADVASLDALCLQHIARFKRPKHYHFVAELPKNHYGKVLKTALREQLRQPAPDPEPPC